MPGWFWACATGLLVSLAGIPLLRKLALASNFVDRPGHHKTHGGAIPYLGGAALIAGGLGAMLFASPMASRVGAIALCAAGLGAIGLVDDDRNVDPRLRFLAGVGAALVAAAIGVRIHASGIEAIDFAVTVVWIVGVTNAFNLLDNMDGLAAGIACVVSLAVFVLALLAMQPVVACAAAGLAGACLGFLVYNRPPARIFMGDAGSLFLGFMLAVLTIEVTFSALGPPVSFLVPLLLLALPVLDTTTVTLGRLRHGRGVSVGGTDHLSHRLVALGLGRGAAVLVLIATEVAVATLAVLAGRGRIPPLIAVVGAGAVLGLLVGVTTRAHVYTEALTGIPARIRLAGVGMAVALAICAAPALVALVGSNDSAQDGVAAADEALEALRVSDLPRATAAFERARADFERAGERLDSPLASAGLVVPGVSSNLRASRTLASIGRRLSAAGSDLTVSVDTDAVRVEQGAVPLDAVSQLRPRLDAASDALERSRRALQGISRAFLVPPVSRAVGDLEQRIVMEAIPARRAALTAQLLPGNLGSDGARHYFVAFQNNAELRGTGGSVGNWGELVAEGGRLRLERFGSVDELNQAGTKPRVLHMPPEFLQRWGEFNPDQFWQQVNVSPDFPTTARVIGDLYPQSGGRQVDGVIAVDPPGLAEMLKLTGPVSVDGWPEPVSADNVVDVMLRTAYERFPDQERVRFLGTVARTVTEAFTSASLGSPERIGGSLGAAAGTGHLLVSLFRPDEQALMAELGADGSVGPVRGDSLLVTNQNIGGNTIDGYLRRTVHYQVRLDPSDDGGPAQVRGSLDVTLENQAPASGLPQAVIGPHDDRSLAGENRSYLSVYSPFVTKTATLEGRRVDLQSQTELGRRVESARLTLLSEQTQTLRMELAGTVRLTSDGWYRLDLLHQTSLTPDRVEVSVQVPQGWTIVEARGAQGAGTRVATADLSLEGDHQVLLKLERTIGPRFWHLFTNGS
ncbi:MAG: hypothetical protein QOD63_1714 [Actinomycetota bacterium]|nr:hypothetical protein [Actinomycetota bacterium]